MTGRTHDLAAATALGVIALSMPLGTMTVSTVVVALVANQLGGIAPDIDQPTAPFWRNLPIGGPVGKVVTRLLGGHRFLTHSLLGVGLLGAAAWAFLQALHPVLGQLDAVVIWWAFIIGVISHLIMDSLTEEGVPWLLPLPVKFGFPPVRAWRITTGKAVETLIIFPGLALVNVWYFSTHYQAVLALLRRHII